MPEQGDVQSISLLKSANTICKSYLSTLCRIATCPLECFCVPLECFCVPLCAAAAARQQAPQRLFGREAENQHTEALGVAALAARTLRQLLTSPTPLLRAPDGPDPTAAAAAAAATDTLQRMVWEWVVSALQVRCRAALMQHCWRLSTLCVINRALWELSAYFSCKIRSSPMQAWARECRRLAATGWAAGASALGGPLQQPAAFAALYRPLLAAWAAAPAFGLATPVNSGSTAHTAQRDVAPGKHGAAASSAMSAAFTALQHGTAALAGLPTLQPQLGNLLVRITMSSGCISFKLPICLCCNGQLCMRPPATGCPVEQCAGRHDIEG